MNKDDIHLLQIYLKIISIYLLFFKVNIEVAPMVNLYCKITITIIGHTSYLIIMFALCVNGLFIRH